MSGGYVVAEGRIQGVRSEIQDQRPMQFLIRCRQPNLLASRVFELDHVVEVRLLPEGQGVLVKTRDADRFCRALNHLALDGIDIEGVAPADDNVYSVYEYLIGGEEEAS
jgi:ABC-2 type transport system ATP-binding protein